MNIKGCNAQVQPLCTLTGHRYAQINFSCLPEQSSDTKEPREGFLGPKGTWSLAFWGNLSYNPFSTAMSTASWQKREARNPQSRHFYRAKRLLASLSCCEFSLCYQRGLKPPKWALGPQSQIAIMLWLRQWVPLLQQPEFDYLNQELRKATVI